MTQETQNLMLEILKRIQADLSEMKDDMRDFGVWGSMEQKTGVSR